jgi:hypothetical protein
MDPHAFSKLDPDLHSVNADPKPETLTVFMKQ